MFSQLSQIMLLSWILLAPVAPWARSDTAESDPPWTLVGIDDGISVYRKKVAGDPVFAYKGEGVLDAPLGKIITVSRDTTRQPEWVNRLKSAKVVREITPFDKIVYLHVSTPWPVSDRDLVLEAKLKVDRVKKTAVFDIHSVEDPLAPLNDCCVRAEVHSNHIELKAVDGGKTEISAVAHVDPRGSLPPWLVNLVQRTFPKKSIEGLLKQVAKPDIQDFFVANP